MKCRLLYITGELHTGGSERQLYYFLRAIKRDQYRPAVVVWNYSEQDAYVPLIRDLGVPLYSLSRGHSRAAKLSALRRIVRQLEPEVVHSWSFYTNFAAYLAAAGKGIICVGSVRSDFSWALKECGLLIGNLSARWPSNQICNSKTAAQTIHSCNGYFLPSQVCVVQNGIDLERFRFSPIPTEQPANILGVGYLLPVKRWDLLLNAIAQLRKRGIKCRARIAGDGPLRPELEQIAKNRGIGSCVEFLGHTDKVAELFAEATFVAHTGDSEGCPNAVMEAMASGRPTIAMAAGDIPLLIEHGRTGFVVPRGDTSALVDHMERLIADRELCERMGEAARAQAVRAFGLDRMLEETLQVYRGLGWKS